MSDKSLAAQVEELVERVAEQQAMPDDSYKPILRALLDDMRATEDGRREQMACASDALMVLSRRLQAVDSNWAHYRPQAREIARDYRKLYAAVKLAGQLD